MHRPLSLSQPQTQWDTNMNRELNACNRLYWRRVSNNNNQWNEQCQWLKNTLYQNINLWVHQINEKVSYQHKLHRVVNLILSSHLAAMVYWVYFKTESFILDLHSLDIYIFFYHEDAKFNSCEYTKHTAKQLKKKSKKNTVIVHSTLFSSDDGTHSLFQ